MRNNWTSLPSALSPIRWPTKAWNPVLALLTVAAIITLDVVPGLIYIVGYADLHGGERALHAPPAFQLLLAQLVAYVPLLIFLFFALPRLARVPLAELGVRKPTGRDIGVGLAGTVAMWLVVVLVGNAMASITHRHDTETAVALLRDLKTPVELGAFFLLACVFAPIAEELVFRLFIFNALTNVTSVARAALLSGALFGAVHALGSSPAELLTIALPLAFGGVVLAYVYATTHCFWSNVTTHACFNGINVAALVFLHAT